jgi:hypothetical protein
MATEEFMPKFNGVEILDPIALALFEDIVELDTENTALRNHIDGLTATLSATQQQLSQATAAMRGFQHQATDAEARLSQRPERETFTAERDEHGRISRLVKESE